jgi:hypothetical protein
MIRWAWHWAPGVRCRPLPLELRLRGLLSDGAGDFVISALWPRFANSYILVYPPELFLLPATLAVIVPTLRWPVIKEAHQSQVWSSKIDFLPVIAPLP